ncbi:hypothetical protein [Clostridium sporogenes]|uniref:hypothetical protein n=1 Tax=Clostridium sporogenes TaxID=1509 RepID=UPI0013D1F4D1|nr:hypothetical protein [Clostridium sporogenes]NFH40800.1 hypothetical protein [Clostridium sporogenes]
MDKVYVIYLDGEMYRCSGRKIAYLKLGSARQVITSESKDLAERMCSNESHKYWWDLNEEEKQQWIDKAKQRFEVREFVEKKCNK